MRRVNSITLSPFGADVVKPLLTSFTEKEVKKYRQWFSLLDSNNTGSVDIGELSSVLLSTEILSSQQQVKQFFSAADCDNSGGITFDEFLSAIDNHVRAKKIKIQKLNDVVKSKAILSKETLLSQERRTVLMKHIVDNSLTRARQLDAAFESAPACGPGQRKLKKQLSLKSMIAKNEIELEESSECLRDIGHLVSQAWQDMRKLASPHNVHCSELSQYGVLPSVESVLSSAALDLVNQKHWKHYSISNKSDTEIRRQLPAIEQRHQLYRSPSSETGPQNARHGPRTMPSANYVARRLKPLPEKQEQGHGRPSGGRVSLDSIRKAEVLRRRRDSLLKF